MDNEKFKKGAMEADERRLIDAACKASILYVGCDTPDMLADTILELRADIDALATGNLEAQHRSAVINTKLRADLRRTRTCLVDVLTWIENKGFIGGVHYDNQSIVDRIKDV